MYSPTHAALGPFIEKALPLVAPACSNPNLPWAIVWAYAGAAGTNQVLLAVQSGARNCMVTASMLAGAEQAHSHSIMHATLGPGNKLATQHLALVQPVYSYMPKQWTCP
jgi:hypothetical protein